VTERDYTEDLLFSHRMIRVNLIGPGFHQNDTFSQLKPVVTQITGLNALPQFVD
jgi:hypothetical protein